MRAVVHLKIRKIGHREPTAEDRRKRRSLQTPRDSTLLANFQENAVARPMRNARVASTFGGQRPARVVGID
jgi:hypothetical protein